MASPNVGAKNTCCGLLQAIALHPPRAPASAQSPATLVLSWASVPAHPSHPVEVASLAPSLGRWAETSCEGEQGLQVSQDPVLKTSRRQAGGNPRGVSHGHAKGRGLAGLPRSRGQTLSPRLSEGRGLMGCAGSWPMGAVKGVALGAAGAALRVFSPESSFSRCPGAAVWLLGL